MCIYNINEESDCQHAPDRIYSLADTNANTVPYHADVLHRNACANIAVGLSLITTQLCCLPDPETLHCSVWSSFSGPGAVA